MRRLIVEISGQDLNTLTPENLQDVKSAEILHFLRFDRQEVALIARVGFNKPNVRIEDVLRDDLIEAQLLEQEKESGICTYFVKAKLSQAIGGEPDLTAGGVYFSLPYEVKDGKIKITSLGTTKHVRGFIKLLEDSGVRYRVVSLTDAQFPPHSLLSRLTEKQRKTLLTAYELGYYDIPKKVGLVRLAERLNLSRSTVDMQLRRAERRLLRHIMNES
jgi:hypothetical protein